MKYTLRDFKRTNKNKIRDNTLPLSNAILMLYNFVIRHCTSLNETYREHPEYKEGLLDLALDQDTRYSGDLPFYAIHTYTLNDFSYK